MDIDGYKVPRPDLMKDAEKKLTERLLMKRLPVFPVLANRRSYVSWQRVA